MRRVSVALIFATALPHRARILALEFATLRHGSDVAVACNDRSGRLIALMQQFGEFLAEMKRDDASWD